MLDILYDFSLDCLKWAFVIVVFLGPIFIILEGILSDIEEKKEAAKRYDVIIENCIKVYSFDHVQYKFSNYTAEIYVIFDDGHSIMLRYDRVTIRESLYER